MNIKINIKDCDCGEPTVITKKDMSEVEFKKKSMLYAPPTKDNKRMGGNVINKKSTATAVSKQQQQQPQYTVTQQVQRKFLKEMTDLSKNHPPQSMTRQTQSILQKQNEILQQNQKTIYHMLSNQTGNNTPSQQQQRNLQLRRTFQQAADNIARQVKDIKKMRDQIIEFGETFKKVLHQNKGQSTQNIKGSQQIGQMNSNLRNLVEISKNHIEGLQNLQGIKSLQNFNIEAYTQAINTLKKQIVQYQKESQTIQRELKLRSAKLQKLQVTPNFNQQLLQPYEQYLKKKAQSIDLHGIKQKVYEKLGVFDYGKFETDVNTLTNQIKGEMNEFYITCKQFRIEIPDIKIDKKELKQLELNLPSVLDQFKQKRGMVFEKEGEEEKKEEIGVKGTRTIKETSKSLKNTGYEQKQGQSTKNLFKRTSPPQIFQKGELYTKPVDYSKSTKLTRLDEKQPKTVLQTATQQQKRQVIKKTTKPKQRSQDEEFEKYLQNRAKQELAQIYEQKRRKLENMQKKLYEKCQQELPQYELTVNVKNKISSVQQQKRIVQGQKEERLYEQQQEYEQQFEQEFDQQVERERRNMKRKQKQPSSMITKQKQQIKAIGTEVLREKLKNLFSKNPSLNEHVHQNRLIQGSVDNEPLHQQQQQQISQLSSIAQGFVNMINNTLTQVNTQLSHSIQKKMQNRSYSIQKRPQFESKSQNKITIPKLQQFRAPPVFNMQMAYEHVSKHQQKRVEKKIVPKDYNYLRISEENNEFEISSLSDEF